MKKTSFLLHLALALTVSFAISLFAWAVLDVYQPLPFWIVSSAAAALGAIVGWSTGKYLATTLTATLIVRSAILFFAISG